MSIAPFGHTTHAITQRSIEGDTDAKRKLVQMIERLGRACPWGAQ